MRFVIGTRGSKLALAQAEYVQQKLQERYPEDEFELRIIKTKGDEIQNESLAAIGDKGLFVKEIERELLDGEIQLAVHSMKDMPAGLPAGLMLAKPWKREDPRDVLILRAASSLAELPAGARIATGSLRRKYQLLRLRPDLEVTDIRGNVETRIRKMEEQGLDGIALAAAGLKRLHLEHRITQYFTPEEMIPAPAQGVLAIEMKESREDVRAMLSLLEDEADGCAVTAERQFLSLMGGGCHLPVGAIGEMAGDEITLRVMYGDEMGEELVFAEVSGKDPAAVAKEAAECVKQKMKG